MSGQLVFPFAVRDGFGREEFIVAPCNEQAFRFVESWPHWPARAAALYGPKGCGKTHLATIWAGAAQARAFPAAEPSLADLTVEAAVLIEDVDGHEAAWARDAQILALLERPKTAVLLTGEAPPTAWPVALADLRSRFDSLIAFAMWAPDDELVSRLVRRHFRLRQLSVSDSIVKRIVTHVERTPEAVTAFIARADTKALSEKRPVSERLVMELIEAEADPRR